MKKLLFLAALSIACFSYSMEEHLLYQVVVVLPTGNFNQEALVRLNLKFGDGLGDCTIKLPDNEVMIIVNSPKKEILQKLKDESWAKNYSVIPAFMTGGPGGERPEFLDQDPGTMSERMREYVQDYKKTYGE